MELVSLQPVLLFHQLKSGLAPVWIHGDWLAKIANISFLYFAISITRCKKVRSNECMIDLRLIISRRSKATQNLEMMAEQTK